MKKLFTLAFVLVVAIAASGQAILPTSWSFNGSAPTGWSTSGTSTYSTQPTALSPPSCKLSGTGQFVMVNVTDDMGPLNYWMRGTGSGSWQGTFTVQESVNGSSWTTLHAFTNSQIDISNYTGYTDNPNAASRFIRFY